MPNLTRALLLGLLLLAAAPPAWAAGRSITMVLLEGDGSPGEAIALADLTVSLGRSTEADTGEMRNQVSVTLDQNALINPKLLAWMGKSDEAATVQFKVEDRGSTTLYVLRGIMNRTVSLSHSGSMMYAQGSMTLGAKHLTVNGFEVN